MTEKPVSTKATPDILVVDDNVMSRKVIQHRLEKDGYTVVLAESGQQALDIIKTSPVGLVFLDMIMDGVSGLDVLAMLQADEKFRDIPVVIVSGSEDAGVEGQCLAAGARRFLHKPVLAAVLQLDPPRTDFSRQPKLIQSGGGLRTKEVIGLRANVHADG